jgi:hypothetical protein
MNDLIEIVEDLESIETFGTDSPGFEVILEKWMARKVEAEEFLERQYEMFKEEINFG